MMVFSHNEEEIAAAKNAVALIEGLHALVFGVHSLGDPEISHNALADGGQIHEYVHAMIRLLPADEGVE